MNYEPKARKRFGMQSMMSSCMRRHCDVCGKIRGKGNHDKCSKARQKAGFIRQEAES